VSAELVEHYFRHEYGRLVAQLARKVGLHRLELVEDAVQSALAVALEAWVVHDVPRDPSAWLYRVAINRLIGTLRRDANRARILDEAGGDAYPASEVQDDLLRMLFVCCDEAIPRESRIVLALKTLCGFSTAEIAHRLFTSEANVHKRLQRARATLREAGELVPPPLEAMSGRVSSVHEVLYLLFNEGYLSTQAEAAIRRELCEEAIRLATLLAEHPVGSTPGTFALLALMHLHAARLDARTGGDGGLLLLEEQDRSRWNAQQLEVGAAWLARSAQGEQFSRYHAEAGIAAEHCFAPSFRETRWQEIAELYAMLDRVAPSPLNVLNRAVAIAERQGPEVALAMLEAIDAPGWLERSYLWDAVVADLCRRAGRPYESHRERALANAPSDAVRDLLRRRLAG
jgi:RNA polymerase sigma-70 factor (ECF subfamily)